MPNVNRYREAFKEKYNMIGMAGFAAASLATLSPIPLLVGVVAEAAYMLFWPDSSYYSRILKLREGAELLKQRQKMRADVLPTLTPDLRARYQRLEQMREQINAQTAEGQQWFSEAPRKFDYLLDKFLVFATKQTQFTQYLISVHDEVCGAPLPQPLPKRRDVFALDGGKSGISTPPVNTAPALDPTDPKMQKLIDETQQKYTRDQQEVTDQLAKEQDESTKAVLMKRLEILKRRAEFLTKISKTLTNLSHQLQLLEDTFGLINDEIRARSPEQVLEDIDDVITQTDTMTKVLDELAPYEQMVNRIDNKSAQQL